MKRAQETEERSETDIEKRGRGKIKSKTEKRQEKE